MSDKQTDDVPATLKADIEDSLATGEDIHSMANSVKNAYAAWPAGTRMFDHIPGFLAGVFMAGVEEEFLEMEELPAFVHDVFEEAGLAGHLHVAEILYIAAEAADLDNAA
ncbi:hypothetical protein [Nonomuraea sp. B19D2]|uniref:hypothetical protein n=1 Tax=Nonomuraea sp. B19D2 TaxID=3159561 RepID=UPI0032DBD283